GYVGQQIATIGPRHRGAPPDRDRDARQWLLCGGVGDMPPHRPRGLLRAERRHPQHPQERPNTAPCSSHTRPLKLKVSPPCNTILPLYVDLSRTHGARRAQHLEPVVVARCDNHAAAVRSPQPPQVTYLAVDRHATALHVDCLEATIPRGAQQQTVAGVLATQ